MQRLKKFIRKVLPAKLLAAVEKGYRKGRGLLWQVRFGFPAKGARVIAVTGTNGKTTTISYINEVLKAAGYKTAVLNTVYYEIAGKRTPNKTHFTLDKQSIVQSFFARAKRARADFVVLEVTSHALDQERIMGIPVEIAVITNLTQDHLDYHGTMKNYAAAKASLLQDFGAKHAILNADDKWYGYFREATDGEVFSFGKAEVSDLRISRIGLSSDGSSAYFDTPSAKIKIAAKLPGEFNIYNAAAAASAGFILGVNPKKIARGIANLSELSGRMEEVSEGQDFKVLVDFAITPDAIEKSLSSLKQITKGQVRVVFGATGDRDKGKRTAMGRAAAKFADAIYLTDDETYTEDGGKIRADVLDGIKQAGAGDKTQVIPDRKEAIIRAFKDSEKGDSVIITGLGHEDSRNMGGKLVPWQDKKVARKLLRELDR